MTRIIRTAHFAYDSRTDFIHDGREYRRVNFFRHTFIPDGHPIADPFKMPQFHDIGLMEEWDDIADVLFCEFIRGQIKD